MKPVVQENKVILDLLVHQDPPDRRELLDYLDQRVSKERLVLLVSPEVSAELVILVSLDVVDPTETKVSPVFQESVEVMDEVAHKVSQAHKETEDHQDLLDQLDLREHSEKPDVPADPDQMEHLAFPAFPEQRDHVEKSELAEAKAHLDPQEPWDSVVNQVHQVFPVRLDPQDRSEPPELVVPKAAVVAMVTRVRLVRLDKLDLADLLETQEVMVPLETQEPQVFRDVPVTRALMARVVCQVAQETKVFLELPDLLEVLVFLEIEDQWVKMDLMDLVAQLDQLDLLDLKDQSDLAVLKEILEIMATREIQAGPVFLDFQDPRDQMVSKDLLDHPDLWDQEVAMEAVDHLDLTEMLDPRDPMDVPDQEDLLEKMEDEDLRENRVVQVCLVLLVSPCMLQL